MQLRLRGPVEGGAILEPAQEAQERTKITLGCVIRRQREDGSALEVHVYLAVPPLLCEHRLQTRECSVRQQKNGDVSAARHRQTLSPIRKVRGKKHTLYFAVAAGLTLPMSRNAAAASSRVSAGTSWLRAEMVTEVRYGRSSVRLPWKAHGGGDTGWLGNTQLA